MSLGLCILHMKLCYCIVHKYQETQGSLYTNIIPQKILSTIPSASAVYPSFQLQHICFHSFACFNLVTLNNLLGHSTLFTFRIYSDSLLLCCACPSLSSQPHEIYRWHADERSWLDRFNGTNVLDTPAERMLLMSQRLVSQEKTAVSCLFWSRLCACLIWIKSHQTFIFRGKDMFHRHWLIEYAWGQSV